MLRLTAAEFISAIRDSDLDGYEIVEDVDHDGTTFDSLKPRLITNCKFKGLRFPEAGFSSLTISNCEMDWLKMTSSKFKLLHIVKCATSRIELSGALSVEKIVIEENSRIESLEINKITAKNIEIKRQLFDILGITNLQSKADVVVNGQYVLKGNLNLEQTLTEAHNKITLIGKFNRIRLIDIFTESLHAQNLSCSTDLSIRSSRLDSIFFEEINTPALSLYECHCDDGAVLNFKGPGVGAYLTVSGGVFNTFAVHGQLSSISISSKLDDSTKIPCVVNDLDLSELERLDKLTIMDLEVRSLNLNYQDIREKLLIQDTNITTSFDVERSTIQNAQFYNVNLSPDTEIKFLNSTLTGAEIINVRWPRGYRFYEYKPEVQEKKDYRDKLAILWSLKESYRQMKVLSLAQHNKIDALYFQKQELNTFLKITKVRTQHESIVHNLGNLFILGSNKIFSDFGQNIWYPLLWLLGFHLLWFTLLLINRFDIVPL